MALKMPHQSSYIAALLSVSALYIAGTLAVPTPEPKTQNITISIPEGSTNHGNPELLCTPTQWEDVLYFFIVNYVAHALTVVVLPGEAPISHLTNALTSLLFPAFGAYRGLRAIFVGYETIKKKFDDNSSEEEQDLRKARRAGALCMIVRSEDWVPQDGDEITQNVLLAEQKVQVSKNDDEKKTAWVTEQEIGLGGGSSDDQALLSGSTIEMSSVPIDGPKEPQIYLSTYPVPWTYSRQECPDSVGSRTIRCAPSDLSPGYKIIMLPSCTPVRELPNDDATDRIASQYDWVKGLIALAQAILALQTLYQTRGDQLKKYGYAAFGLTVAPYAIMSVVNLLGALSRPDYDAVYLVGSPIMVEERRRKGLDGYYDGVVGEVFDEPDPAAKHPAADFSTKYVTEGVTTLSSPIKFVSTDDGLYAKFTTPSEDAMIKVSTSFFTHIEHRSIFVPNMPAISYNLTKSTSLNTTFSCDRIKPYESPRWPQSILPRSTRYLERSRNLSFVISLTPLIPIGVLSHFHAGDSTRSQRAITMLWLAWGSFIGYLVAEFSTKDTVGVKVKGKWKTSSVIWRAVWLIFFGSPAVAGWVIVGLQLNEYGSCIKLPGN